MIGSGHGKGLDIPQSLTELDDIVTWCHGEEVVLKHGSVVVDADNGHTISEGGDIQFFEKFRLTGGDDITDLDQIFGGSNFDLTLLDLGGEFQGVEKFNIGWVDAGGAFGDLDRAWSDLSDFGLAWLDDLFDSGLDASDEFLSEDHGNSAFDVWF